MIRLPLSDLLTNAGLSFTIDLAGDVFGFVFRYNERDACWYFDLYDEDDSLIVGSVKVIVAAGLLVHVGDPRRPKGELACRDLGAGGEPTLGTLGRDAGHDVIFASYVELLS